MASGKHRGEFPSKSIPKAKRDQIPVLHSQGYSLGAIARELELSKTMVHWHAKKMGLEFNIEATRKSIAAHKEELRRKRQALAKGLLEDAEWARKLMRSNGERVTSRGELVELSRPDGREAQAFMTTTGIAIQRSIELERVDGGDAAPEVNLLTALGQALGLLKDDEETEDSDEDLDEE